LIDFSLARDSAKIGNRKFVAPPTPRAQKNFGVRGHPAAAPKAFGASAEEAVFKLQSAAANEFSWQSKIDNLKSKIVEAPLAQLAEQLTLNQRVAGSIPARCTPMKNWWFTRFTSKAQLPLNCPN
jgi:hypothetical protein